MQKLIISIGLSCLVLSGVAQTPKTYTSSEVLLHLRKLEVLGSVLYIAAHPDDENTPLLAYLANGKLYRTGYLSLTRGDGGQNLIGDEQGTALGLIRTQELLSARRIDGAEQFFSRAYDFGFCKTPQEALDTWGHDKILSDVVWVIRKFRPDVIITRFPEDSRAGHGHHSASSILAREAFDAAADATQFPDQLKKGVTVWQAKRLLWNTYNFGDNNTQSEDQFKLDCGGYNALLGKSYGEIAALSRSQHKTQGFGVAAQRGTAIEYFSTTKGDPPVYELMDGIATDWSRVKGKKIGNAIKKIIDDYSAEHPEHSVAALVQVYQAVQKNIADPYWKEQKLKEIKELIKECSGLFLEAATTTPYAVQGDSLKISYTINNRLGVLVSQAAVEFNNSNHVFDSLNNDENANYTQTVFIADSETLTQPYWLVEPMDKGSFNVSDQQLIGKAENDPLSADFNLTIDGVAFDFKEPVRYKYTDPVKGELYEPLAVLPSVELRYDKDIYILPLGDSNAHRNLKLTSNTNRPIQYRLHNIEKENGVGTSEAFPYYLLWKKDSTIDISFLIANNRYGLSDHCFLQAVGSEGSVVDSPMSNYSHKSINYDHIPSIVYFKKATAKAFFIDLKTAGPAIGYIPGAGDKVPDALEQMGYKVTLLKEEDITDSNLKRFDAIITGVRAYNIHGWLNKVYNNLMNYVKQGGVLLAQYNTNSGLSSINSKIGPYPFTVVNKRITDETAQVNFLLPNDAVLNYPNKITSEDFDGWIQERSIYDVENVDSHYQRILSMKDPGENEQEGSLIVARYGKGKFVYTGLVFFRELPVGVPGAYRLFANLIAK
jgi:LmbE family N-acetylglucosaminyl deacetylase